MEKSADGDAALLKKTTSHASSHSEKEEAILKACQWRDLEALKVLAESPGGFMTDAIRQQACKSTQEITNTISFALQSMS